MAQKLPTINLAKKPQKSFIDSFIDWALTIGRIIIIITEGIALAVFLFRFSLDMRLVDLHGQIKRKQAIVQALKPEETKYRDLQNRLLIAAKFQNAAPQTNSIFNEIISLTSKDVVLNKLSLSADLLHIEADISSVTTLTQFIQTLKNNPKIATVSLDKVENKTSTGTITITVTTRFKVQLQ